MEIASTAGSILSDSSDHKDSASVVTTSFLSESAAVTTNSVSNEPSMNLLTVRNQNGQFIIQQPLKMMSGSSALLANGVSLGKGHIIVKQKPLLNLQPAPTSESNPVTMDTSNLGNIGMKRPLTSSGNNVITKVIITKNPLSGQAQAFPVGSSSQTIALTSPASSSHIKTASQVTQMAATLTKAPGGASSPIKTVIATGMPYYKIPTSPVKTPTKITMIPVSGSPNKQSISSNITVLSHALTAAAQSGTVPIRPGTTSKVIIKQGPAPSGSSTFTLKGPLPTLAPHTAQPGNQSQIVQTLRPTLNPSIHPISAAGSAGTVQQIQVPGSRFHYVRLVSPTNNSLAPTTPAAKVGLKDGAQVASIPVSGVPLTVTPAPMSSQVKVTLPLPQQQNTPLAPKPTLLPVSVSTQQGVHQLVLPSVSAHSNPPTTLVPIQPAPVAASVPSFSQLPHGATILASTGTENMKGMPSFALVPASYVTQLQQQLNKTQVSQVTTAPSAPKQTRDYVPIASIDPAVTQYTVSRNVPNTSGPTLEATGARPRKPCNCTKSQCLKLYCDCFANGEFCQNCNCTNCANNLEHEEERSKAIKSCLDRNPHAFHPKIGKSKDIEGSRRHNKGCNCKRSGCLKNYCECYEAKIMCSNFCKCIGCKNFEESPERKTLMHLADAAEVRVQQQTAAKTKLSSQISSVPSRPPAAAANGERLPFALITADVAEATAACLLAQAEEAERMKMPPVVQERMIIEEFGRCLMQIIESANRTRTSSVA